MACCFINNGCKITESLKLLVGQFSLMPIKITVIKKTLILSKTLFAELELNMESEIATLDNGEAGWPEKYLQF